MWALKIMMVSKNNVSVLFLLFEFLGYVQVMFLSFFSITTKTRNILLFLKKKTKAEFFLEISCF